MAIVVKLDDLLHERRMTLTELADRIDITGADGAPVGSSRLVYLAVPVKQSGSNTVGQMIIAGLTTEPKDGWNVTNAPQPTGTGVGAPVIM